MKYLIILTLFFSSCATKQAIDNINASRKYTPSQKSEIDKYVSKYMWHTSKGSVSSNIFDSSREVASVNTVKNVLCSCVKKLGSKCQAPASDVFSESEKRLWTKGNAAEIVLYSSGNGVSADIDTCP